MIKSFFQSLSDRQVDYLLISGQASVLYGAATFSEDIDLWMNPTENNRLRFLKALEAQQARCYKLSPPFSIEHLDHGHGFHFVLGDRDPVFLDVMGCPPRAPAFEQASQRLTRMDTPWGLIATVGIRDLIELKKTQRLTDYPIISRLALRELEALETPRENDYLWAVNHVFTLNELHELITTYPNALQACRHTPILYEYAEGLLAKNGESNIALEEPIEPWLADRVLKCQRADREYWRTIMGLRPNLWVNSEELKAEREGRNQRRRS